jgi:hypothetical protein
MMQSVFGSVENTDGVAAFARSSAFCAAARISSPDVKYSALSVRSRAIVSASERVPSTFAPSAAISVSVRAICASPSACNSAGAMGTPTCDRIAAR